MLKNIILYIALLISIFFLVYSNIKLNEADWRVDRAIIDLEKLTNTANQAEEMAAKNAALAIQHKIIADSLRNELEACNK